MDVSALVDVPLVHGGRLRGLRPHLRIPEAVDCWNLWGTADGPALKAWLITAQVLRYTIAKIIGIRVIVVMTASRRSATLLALIGLAGLAYLFITVLRSVRADFAPEIWAGLGLSKQASGFTESKMWVALGVVLANGTLVLVRNNRSAFLIGLGLCAAGLGLAAGSILAFRAELIPPFTFMVLLGLGMYLPYVPVHTTILERLFAMTRERANVGFLMYFADAVGYVGYAAVMMGRSAFPAKGDFLNFFLELAFGLMGVAFFVVFAAWIHFLKKFPDDPNQAQNITTSTKPSRVS